MKVSEQAAFESAPHLVKRAICGYVAKNYPEAAGLLEWDASGRRATASKMGASGELFLSGSGPTLLEVKATIGLPASLLVSKRSLQMHFRQAIAELKKSAP